jgi:exosortase
MLFYIVSAILISLIFLADFTYISTIGFSFANDSLGPFVFLVSAYVIFINWDQIKKAPVKPQPLGLIGVVASILLYFAALRAELPQAYHVSFIFFLLSSLYYLFGRAVTGLLLFPVAYTFFVIPISFMKEMIGIPLRFFVSTVSAGLFNLLGMQATRVGTSIYTGDFSFDIAAPCSGINSLISLLALSAVFAYLTERSNLKRLILFISAIPIAIVTNIIRVTSIGLVAKGLNKEMALSLYHDYSGYVIFAVSLGLLFLEKKLLDHFGKGKIVIPAKAGI